ncbi:LPXTG cell wall anchor domain-containing protein [Aurantimonas aggregata]|uniref:LPXTG cell wall anchor domain-containing protein n=1 Tax=Aurantimonas aggregata TaxID=2047720 RepID=A0A6L9MMS7_9HYPH|nr:WGxxGxxG family protein [Aurantimonas aggregata]NDV88820.1 LPXTG cell wall anchor domain-containing protein [Aurantimonas aggregata]
MRRNPLYAATLTAGLLSATGTAALAQATAPDTETVQPITTQNEDDGFDLGWLGLIGLLGLAGLAGRKRNTHIETVNRPIDPANRPRV